METEDSNKKESRGERFKRVAEKRTNRLLNEVRLLGNCSNKSTYEYTQEDLDKIFNAIEEAIRNTKARFKGDQKLEFKL